MRRSHALAALCAAGALLVRSGVVAAPAGATSFAGPTVTSSFNPDTVAFPATTTLSIQIYNPNPAGHSEAVDIDDEPGAAVYRVASPSNLDDSCPGSATADPGADAITVSATVEGGSLCVLSVDVVPQSVGVLTDHLQVTATDTGGTVTDGSLTVLGPPTLRTGFSTDLPPIGPSAIRVGDTVPLTYLIDNPNSQSELTGIGLDDPLPAGLVIAEPNGVTGTCNGTLTAVAGTTDISLSGVSLPALSDSAGECYETVQVKAVADGYQRNITSDISSTEGGAGDPGIANISIIGPGPRLFVANSVMDNGFSQLAMVQTDGKGAGAGLLNGLTDESAPFGFALDPASDRVFWQSEDESSGNQAMHYGSIEGQYAGDVDTGSAHAYGLGVAFDPTSNRLYFSPSSGSGFDYTTPGHGGVTHVAVPGGGSAFGGLALDRAAKRMYWVGSDGIESSRLDGSDLLVIDDKPADLSGPQGIAIDTADGRAYWANVTTNTIGWAALNGSGSGTVDTTGATVDAPLAVAVDPIAGRVYWSNFSDDSVSYASLSGGGGADLNIAGADIHSPATLALLYPPKVGRRYAVTGTPTVGRTLHCSGSWAADLAEAQLYRAPHEVSYRWQRNGVNVTGATLSHLVTSTPGRYRCRVTAVNSAGSASTSTAVRNVSYAAPGTRITSSAVSGNPAHAVFRFTGAGNVTGFQCALRKTGGRPAYHSCTSPTSYRRLGPGHYAFRVRAVGPGGADRSPAKKSFVVARTHRHPKRGSR